MGALEATIAYDKGGMFTPDQKTGIAQALTAKHLNPCQACGKVGTWTLGDDLVLFPFHYWTGISFSATGQSYPCIPVVCSNCGNTMFHNAFTLGVAGLLGLTCAPASPAEVGRNG